MLLILATAIFLALGVNFRHCLPIINNSAYRLPDTASRYSKLNMFLCWDFHLKSIVFGSTGQIVRLRGAIFYNINDDNIKPVEIIGYSFNDDFCRYLSAFLHENSASWKLFSKERPTSTPMSRFDPDDLNHHTIINSDYRIYITRQA